MYLRRRILFRGNFIFQSWFPIMSYPLRWNDPCATDNKKSYKIDDFDRRPGKPQTRRTESGKLRSRFELARKLPWEDGEAGKADRGIPSKQALSFSVGLSWAPCWKSQRSSTFMPSLASGLLGLWLSSSVAITKKDSLSAPLLIARFPDVLWKPRSLSSRLVLSKKAGSWRKTTTGHKVIIEMIDERHGQVRVDGERLEMITCEQAHGDLLNPTVLSPRKWWHVTRDLKMDTWRTWVGWRIGSMVGVDVGGLMQWDSGQGKELSKNRRGPPDWLGLWPFIIPSLEICVRWE